MAQQRTEDLTWQSGASSDGPIERDRGMDPADAALAASAEFRELARQRRFLREHEQAGTGSTTLTADTSAPAHPVASAPSSAEGRAILASLKHANEQIAEAAARAAAAAARADHAERELAAANERLMAANVLVQDAQRATHQSAERCAWLEGRTEALQEALEVAVHASVTTRWRWRRQMAAAKKARRRDAEHHDHHSDDA
jgi:hypothetical protein